MLSRGMLVRLFYKVITRALLAIVAILLILIRTSSTYAQADQIPNYIWPVETLTLDIIKGGTDNVDAYASGIRGDLVVRNQKNVWLSIQTSGASVTPVGIFAPLGVLPPEGLATYNTDFTLVGQAALITAKYDYKAWVWNASTTAVTLIPQSSILSDVALVEVLELVNDLPQIQCAANEFVQINGLDIVSLSHLQRGSWCLVKLADSDDFVNILINAGLDVSKDKLKEYLVVWDIYEEGKKIIETIFVIIDAPYGASINFEAHYNPSPDPPVPPPPLPVPPPSPELDQAVFVTDVILPDGTVVSPGEVLTKIWRLRNIGSTSWGNGYKLVFVGGEQMSAPVEVSVPEASPGQEVDISVNLITPSVEGEHVGYWRLRNPQGTYFGPTFSVSISVPGGTEPDDSNYSLICLDCPSEVPPGYTFRPTIRATIGEGQLLESRGDMLLNTDENLFGAYKHIAVSGIVNQNQSYDFTFYSEYPITAPDNEGIYQTKWRLWQDGNWAGPELTIEFKVESSGGTNHPPNTPTLTGPGDWALYYGNMGINLSAQHNGDPDGDAVTAYYFEIYDSAQNANSGWISSNSWSPQGLGFNNYQWRAKVRDSRGAESDWSQPAWHFSILNNDPEIYSFSWQWCHDPWGKPDQICFCASTNAGTLRLQVNNAVDGSATGDWQVLNELGTSNYSCNDDNDRPPTWTQLEYETGTHLVRLYARRDGGWENAAHQDLTIYLPADRKPNNPPLRLPVHDSYLNSLDVHFDWEKSLRTDNYRLQISTDPGFSSHLVDIQLSVNTTEYDYTFASDFETVYWRVTANGPYGSNTSDGRFHIDITPPASSMTALAPVSMDTKFSVNWGGTDARSGLRWYHVQVRDGIRPDSVWTDWLVNTTKTAELFQGQTGHTYYFRVRAMDKVGNWETWPGGEGDTYTMVDPSAAPQTEWWDENYTWKRNLIILNNDNDPLPVNYPMHVHFDSSTTPTAAEVYNASMASTKGNDVRIVFNNQTGLNRFIQRFTSNQIDIWFPLQAALGGGNSNSSSYQIYYGYAGADNPPANINAVFLPKVDANTMGLWHFQEGSGSTVYDSSGRSHNGNFINAGWADGYLGRTGSFNGSNAYVEISHSDDFKPGAITLEAWIYLTGSTGEYPMIFNKDRYGVLLTNLGEVQFIIKADGGDRIVTGATKLNQNQWYHIAASYNGGQRMRIWVDGKLDREFNDGAPPTLWNTQPLRIGRSDYDSASYFPGYIHHARVSNVERTSFEYGKLNIKPSLETGALIEPSGADKSDLTILDLNTYPNPDGGLLVQAVMQNQGDRDTINGFYTDLYVDHIPTGAGDYSGSLQFWVNDPIAAGAAVTLTTVLKDMPLTSISVGDAISESSGVLYAQTDSAGAVAESDDQNNIHSEGVEVCVASADAYEGDDSAAAASTIGLGKWQSHNFDSLGDQDWLKFTAEVGKTYLLSTSNLGLSADTYLYLYDTTGSTLLVSNDDYGGALASRLEWTAADSGTYYVRIRHWNPNVGGCGTTYNFAVGELREVFLPLTFR